MPTLGSTPVITCYDAGNVVNASCVGSRRVQMLVTQAANAPSPDVPSPTPYTFTLAYEDPTTPPAGDSCPPTQVPQGPCVFVYSSQGKSKGQSG